MNAKYALALILSLQVSMCLCEAPTPADDLVQKYDSLKSVFFKRLMNAFGKLQENTAPLVEKYSNNDQGTAVKDYVEGLQTKPELQAAIKVVGSLAENAKPLVDQARSAVLGAYGHYLRPKIGDELSSAIDHIKVYLDQYLPAE